jgi:hypothetical protein
MKKTFLIVLLCAVNILVIGAFIIWLLNRSYPIIGHDYRLFMPYMLDSYLHQKINGLTIQWYTPSFAGGRPVFPNPQDLQFSLPQFLMWIVNPWIAILASILVYITIGFTATYYFLKKLLGLHPLAAILGAVFFIANGFYFEHMAVGHVTFQAFPLFAVIMVILTHPKLPGWLGGVFLSLVITILLYSGIHNIPSFLLAGIIIFPLLYLIRPSLLHWKRLASLALWGGLFTALVCGSKIYAVYSFMRFFPRFAQDHYSTNLWTGTLGIIHQLLGTMTLAPLYRILQGRYTGALIVDLVKSTGSLYGYWELDASISPALLLLLAGGTIALVSRKRTHKAPFDKKRLLAGLCLVLAIWLVIEFTLAKGFIYPHIQNLPIFASLRANVRYVSAFIFPLALVGAVIFDKLTKNWKSKTLLAGFLVLDFIALGSLVSYHDVVNSYLVGERKYQYMQCDYKPIQDTYDKIRYEGAIFPVKNVVPDADPWAVFQENATNLIDPYNTYFRSLTDYRTALHAGPVNAIDNGFYNLIDPTGYILPEANHSSMYERIPVADKAKFLDFINRRQPKWNLPIIQQVLGWISLSALIAEFGVLFTCLARKFGLIPKHPAKA